MKRTLIVVALFASACAGNPTAPTPAHVPVVAAVEPAPAPPVDEPAPPVVEPPTAPTPAPEPAPAPPAPQRELYDGTTAGGHWYGAPRVPQTFTLEVTADALIVDGVAFPMLLKSDGSYTAGTYPVETFAASRDTNGAWSWTYSGSAGQAFGALERR
jgi:hypothetical protein